MNRSEKLREQFDLGMLQSIDVTKFISNMIADEIEAQAEFLDIEGDLYGVANGLRKAAQIARTYKQEGQADV